MSQHYFYEKAIKLIGKHVMISADGPFGPTESEGFISDCGIRNLYLTADGAGYTSSIKWGRLRELEATDVDGIVEHAQESAREIRFENGTWNAPE